MITHFCKHDCSEHGGCGQCAVSLNDQLDWRSTISEITANAKVVVCLGYITCHCSVCLFGLFQDKSVTPQICLQTTNHLFETTNSPLTMSYRLVTLWRRFIYVKGNRKVGSFQNRSNCFLGICSDLYRKMCFRW